MENRPDVNGYLRHAAAERGQTAAGSSGRVKPVRRQPCTHCSGLNGCGARGTPALFDPGVEFTRPRIDVTAAAAGVEFPGVRVEDPVALGGIELPRLRVDGTAVFGRRRNGRHRSGGWRVHLRLGPLRYRRRRAGGSPGGGFRQIPGGLPNLEVQPRPQERKAPRRGRCFCKNRFASCLHYDPLHSVCKDGPPRRASKNGDTLP